MVHRGDEVDDAIGRLPRDGVTDGLAPHLLGHGSVLVHLGARKLPHMPGLSFVVGQRDIGPPLDSSRRPEAIPSLIVPREE